MRAICVMKMLLMVVLIADAGMAFASEDTSQRRLQAPAHGGQLQERRLESRRFADSVLGRRVVANVAYEVLSADLFATDRSLLFAPPFSAANSFILGGGNVSDSGFTAADQQRNIVLLNRQIAAAGMRSAEDVGLMALVGLMLVSYQLCRKHRFLRPQPFAL